MKHAILFLFVFITLFANAKEIENDSTLLQGQLDYSSAFFKDRVLYNSYVSFLDNYSDYITVQNEAYGDFHSPDRQLISIQGNSYRWTEFYMDGMRMDSRINPGSALYTPNMNHYHLSTDMRKGALRFEKDNTIQNNLMMRYNFGDIGGISPWTQTFISHANVEERRHLPIEDRKHLIGQGVAFVDFNIEHKGQTLPQHLYLDFGNRQLINVDYTGLASPYNENYAKAELNGQLPSSPHGLFSKAFYAFAFAKRDQMNHEYYYQPEETAQNQIYNFSLWGQGKSSTTGLNFSINNQQHNNKDFSRNYVDMDGESLQPYSPDAIYYEATHFYDYHKKINDKLSLDISTYNSLIHTQANNYSAQNAIYYQSLVDPLTGKWLDESTPYYQSLYVSEWSSQSFTSGLLENEAQLSHDKSFSDKLKFHASASITLDGMLLKDKSIVRPNWEFETQLTWDAGKFFSTGLTLGRKRIPFHFDQIKYFSNNYLNGNTYYWNDKNEDQLVQDTEKGDLQSTFGGDYRSTEKGIAQPAYCLVEWPMLFRFSPRHEFSVYTSYKKYYNMWQVEMAGGPSKYGFYKDVDGFSTYFTNDKPIHYTINDERPATMALAEKMAFISNTPFALTNVMKYSYNGKKIFLSVSWVSQAMMSTNTAGNSIQENNVEHLSDLAANPNTHYKQIGRPQQDRGYFARMLLGYKHSDRLRTSFLLKFVDGQPFTHYETMFHASHGHTQVAQRNKDHKGAVPFEDGWGSREDFIFNTEFRVAYTFQVQDYNIDLNAGIYNLFDFRTELNEAIYALPAPNGRIPIEVNIPRGCMLSAKVSF